MNQQFTDFSEFRSRYPIRPHDESMSLGSGSYGKVVKVEDQLETEWVAIKISEFKGVEAKSLHEEIKLAQRIPRQANIARYDACFRFETDTGISDFAVMKYYPDGNLAQLLKRERLSNTQIYDLTKGILLGLQHLHAHRIVHRDFKPANILISRDNAGKLIPKIADFGLSKLVEDEEIDNSDFDLSDGRGTPSYKAPEQIEGSRVSFNLDLWAFGVILYEIMTGEKVFLADTRSGTEQAIRRAIELKIISVQLPLQLNQVSQPYQSIIRRCLVRDIHQRARKEVELLDLLDNIPQLLREAQEFENQSNYESARVIYERLLRLSPKSTAAIRGLSTCIARSRPVAPTVIDEPTDTYVPTTISPPAEALSTDVFVAEKKNVVATKSAKSGPANVSPTKTLPPKAPTEAKKTEPVRVKVSLQATTLKPWWYAVPIVAALGGIGLYGGFWRSKTPISAVERITDSVSTTAISVGVANVPAGGETVGLPPAGTLPRSPPYLLRLVTAMRDKGANAEAQRLLKAYNKAATGTSQQQQMVLLRVKQAAAKYAGSTSVVVPELPVSEPVTPPATNTLAATNEEPAKPKEAEPAVDKAATAKQEAQQVYDQLIDKGTAAIANGNNKAAAISFFEEARQLADKQELDTGKGRNKYSFYMEKAGRILASDDYEGARSWYLVAQAISNTAEVKARIRQCTNQTN